MKLLQPIPAGKQREGRRHFIIAVLLIIVAAAFWYNIHFFLTHGLQFTTSRMIQLAGTLLLFGTMNGLVGIIGFSFKDFLTRLIVYFFGIATHFIFFGLTYFSVITATLLWLVWLRYGRNTGWEERERIHFHSVKILTHTLGTLITLSLLAFSFSYYGIVVQDAAQRGVLIDRVARGATSATISTLGHTTDAFDPDMTLDAFIDRYAGEQIKELFPSGLLPENLSRLLVEREITPDTKTPLPLPPETLAEFRRTLLTEFGIETQGTEPIRNVIAEIVSKRLHQTIGPYERYIPPILALSLFIGLTAFGLLYFWASVCMGWICTKLLFLVRILTLKQQTTPVDQLIVE